MREEEGLEIHVIAQLATMAHKIHGFIEKAARAGVDRVFIGPENINPNSLKDVPRKRSSSRQGTDRKSNRTSSSFARLFLEATEKCSRFICPEARHIMEAGVPQPFHLVFQGRTLAVEIDEAASAFNERKYIGVDALDYFRTAGVVNRDGRDDGFEGPG